MRKRSRTSSSQGVHHSVQFKQATDGQGDLSKGPQEAKGRDCDVSWRYLACRSNGSGGGSGRCRVAVGWRGYASGADVGRINSLSVLGNEVGYTTRQLLRALPFPYPPFCTRLRYDTVNHIYPRILPTDKGLLLESYSLTCKLTGHSISSSM